MNFVDIPERDDTVRHGCSLAALVELADMYDYVLIETTLYNAFFVPNDLYMNHFAAIVPDTSIEALHECTMGTEIYQLYDGTLKLWGCRKLLWHRITLDEQRIQMLPSSKRIFPFSPDSSTVHDRAINDSAIDVGSYCRRNFSKGCIDNQRLVCCKELFSRLQSDGFALVRGTGIKALSCRKALSATHSFLQEADESVRRSCLSRDRARRGYSPQNTENFASLLGESGPNDLVRKYRIGPISNKEKLSGSSTTSNEKNNNNASSLLQENIWPTASGNWSSVDCEDFRATIEEYYDEICIAANNIVQCICDGLFLKYPAFSSTLDPILKQEQSDEIKAVENNASAYSVRKSFAHNNSILTLLGYRLGTRHKKSYQKKKRIVHPLVAAHTDVGVITVLIYDNGDCAALQRECKLKDGSQFENVTLPFCVDDDPVFVINIGDCLSAVSNGALPSTVHRVVPGDGDVPRNCLALFTGFKTEQIITIDGEKMTYEAWRKRRIEKSQNVLRGKTKSKK